jgi:hypothetical protein
LEITKTIEEKKGVNIEKKLWKNITHQNEK